MANEQNLQRLTSSKAREIGSKGGKRSGEVRREKKLLRELLEEALLKDIDGSNRYVNITTALIKEAEKGNVKAYETIRDTLGEKPKEKISVGVSYEEYIKKVEDEKEY